MTMDDSPLISSASPIRSASPVAERPKAAVGMTDRGAHHVGHAAGSLNDRQHDSPIHGEQVLIAVDGGGTRTRSAAFDRTGQIRAQWETGPSNHLVSDTHRALASLAESIAAVLKACGAEREHVHAVSAGLAGVDVGGEGLLEARECLHRLGFENSIISADIVTAHAGALGGEPGVLALAGTGAAFFGVTRDGRHARAGGWGPVYGDEGSAYWIGQMSLQAAAAAYDGRGPKTALVELICDALGLRSFSETLQCIYRSKSQVHLIADLSRTAEAAAAARDGVAHNILERAGDELANGVASVAGALDGATGCEGSEYERCQVTWEGAVLRNSAIVRERFCSTLLQRVPEITIVPPRFDPIYGAYLIGSRAVGWEMQKP
jgi:N-acetylglucosamine kinase-like BadF-type ATPase